MPQTPATTHANEHNKPFDFFASWSGGKDIALATWRMVQQGHRLKALFCMLDETNQRSRSHGLPPAILQAQADAMGVPIVFRSATWNDYTDTFVDGLHELKAMGLAHGVFGDIDIDAHKQWVVDVCNQASTAEKPLTPHHPLWQQDRTALVTEGIDAGIQTRIVVVQTAALPPSFLGRTLDRPCMQAIVEAGADACGENGEYHSLVTDAPLYASPLSVAVRETITPPTHAFEQLNLI